MTNYIKVPAEKYAQELSELLNDLIQKSEKNTLKVKLHELVIKDKSLNFKLSGIDGNTPSTQSYIIVAGIIKDLGIIYECN